MSCPRPAHSAPTDAIRSERRSSCWLRSSSRVRCWSRSAWMRASSDLRCSSTKTATLARRTSGISGAQM